MSIYRLTKKINNIERKPADTNANSVVNVFNTKKLEINKLEINKDGLLHEQELHEQEKLNIQLLDAVKKHNFKECKKTLEEGADPNAIDEDEKTALLLMAVINRDTYTTELLLELLDKDVDGKYYLGIEAIEKAIAVANLLYATTESLESFKKQ